MRWLLTGLFVVVTASTALAQPKAKDTPSGDALKFAGKTFEQWVKDISNRDPSKRETAIRVVCLYPPATAVKALPALIGELKRSSPVAPVDLSVRVNICIALADIFSMGEKIETRVQADAVSALRAQLRDSQAILRYRAAAALAAIGSEARPASPELTTMIKDNTTWEVRQAGASALAAVNVGNAGGPPVAVLNSLYEALHDTAYQVRLAGVQSLSVLGPASGQTATDAYVAALLPIALKDPEPGLQIWARIAIIGATNDFKADNIDPIAKHATNESPAVRAQAVQALGTIGKQAKKHVSTLIKCLKDDDTSVQISAMWACGRMEIHAADAIPVLRKIADDPNSSDYLKRQANDAIKAITPK